MNKTMAKIINQHLPKALLILAVTALTSACSSISIPGSQLIGQQNNDKSCIDKMGKTISGCITKDKVVASNTPKREPLRLLADKPVITAAAPQKTIVTAEKPQLPLMTKPKPAPIGVVASPVIMPHTPIAIAKPIIVPPVAPAIVRPVIAPKSVVFQQATTRRLTLNGSATFKTGSSTLSSAGKNRLDSLARSLQGPNTTITRLLIDGHTDSSGAAAFNQVLSLKRANAVADYLASRGLVRSSMETVGSGENNPIADNKTKAGRSQNRRVEITARGTRKTIR